MKNRFVKLFAMIAVICLLLTAVACGGPSADKIDPPVSEDGQIQPQGEELLTLGVISDSQLRPKNEANGNMATGEEHFGKALTYLKNRGVDGIVMNGDMVDYATEEAYDVYENVLKQSLGESDLPLVFSPGNHECFVLDSSKPKSYAFELFTRRTGFQPDSYTEIAGYPVISLATDDYYKCTIPEKSLNFLRANIEKAAKAAEGGPIFVCSHAPITNTVIGSESDATPEGGVLYGILKDYPNAVLLTSHTHRSVFDERSIHQSKFTTINTGTLSYGCVGVYDGKTLKNASGLPFDNVNVHSNTADANPMSDARPNNTAQALVFRVYKNATFIERIDVLTERKVGADWVLNHEKGTEGFAYTEAKRESASPEFAADAQMSAVRSGNKIVVHFPDAKGKYVVESYVITVRAFGAEEYVGRKVIVSDYYCGNLDSSYKAELIVPDDGVNYGVFIQPIDCFGNKGTEAELTLS